MCTIAEIEDAVVGRLRAEVSSLRTCASLAHFLAKEIADIALVLPAAYVAYEQGEFDHKTNGVQDRTMVFNVFVMAGSMRGDEASRHGCGTESGVYTLLDDVRAALTNHDCGLDIDPLRPKTEHAVDGDRYYSIYAISFETRCRFFL